MMYQEIQERKRSLNLKVGSTYRSNTSCLLMTNFQKVFANLLLLSWELSRDKRP